MTASMIRTPQIINGRSGLIQWDLLSLANGDAPVQRPAISDRMYAILSD
jgi:hypothetical protein